MRQTIVILAVIAFCSISSTTSAQVESKTEKRAEYTRSMEELKQDKPAEYEKTRLLITLATEMLLGRLGYGVGPFEGILDEKAQTALRLYQKNSGIPVTGDPLSFETFEQMNADIAVVNAHPVVLPFKHVYTDFWDDGYVTAQGTWTIVGEEMGMPEQTSQLTFDRGSGVCVEYTATISGEGSSRSLSTSIDTYEIERWDEHEIVTKPLQFGCVRYVRRVNRIQKSVTGIRSTISTDENCRGLDNEEKYLELVDGSEVWRKLSAKQGENRQQLMQISPDVKAKLSNMK